MFAKIIIVIKNSSKQLNMIGVRIFTFCKDSRNECDYVIAMHKATASRRRVCLLLDIAPEKFVCFSFLDIGISTIN